MLVNLPAASRCQQAVPNRAIFITDAPHLLTPRLL